MIITELYPQKSGIPDCAQKNWVGHIIEIGTYLLPEQNQAIQFVTYYFHNVTAVVSPPT